MSTVRTNTITDVSGGNSMPVADINQGRAKAWYNLNGTGTIAVRDSFNCASFVDNGTGDYSANFSVAMANANYKADFSATSGSATVGSSFNYVAATINTSFLRGLLINGASGSDMLIAMAGIHGDA